MSSVLLSWGLFLAIAFAGCWWYGISSKLQPHGKRFASGASEKPSGGSVFVSSGTDGNTAEKKKGKKKKKAALSNTAPKKAASNEAREKVAESTDDDAARDEDELQSLRRLQSLNEGNVKKGALSSSSGKQAQSQKPHLTAPASPFATASQTSSTGADADIDEEEAHQLSGSGFHHQSSSVDPSDMVEESAPGARVLSITPSTHVPRSQKQKPATSSTPSGTHASKNAKKKEKKKLEKEVERADQKARFEQHRATMRAAEVAKQKGKPSDALSAPSVWTTVNGKKSSTLPTNTSTSPSKLASNELLDTFTTPEASAAAQHTLADSEEDKTLMRSGHLDESYWEEIPEYLTGGWNEVQRKGRKQKKGMNDPDAGKSGDESADVESTKILSQPKPERPAVSRKDSSKKETSKTVAPQPSKAGGFQLLDTGSSTTSDTKNSSSDWAEVDDSDNWAVHPES